MGSSPPIPQPEILPPSAGYGEPAPQERRKPRPIWRAAPATYLLVGINCAVFLAMVAHHISPISPTTEQLFNWGGDHAGAVLIGGQWWRIVTAMFVHVGILHLATNMWCLWNLGLLAEPLMGSAGVLAVYLLTGAAGNLLSTMINWIHPVREAGEIVFPVGAGASGAVFGIAGALIVLLKSPRLPVPPVELKKLRRSVIYFAAINLVLGLSISGGTQMFHAGISIDNMAHLGGFSCGLLFAAPMVPRLGSPRPIFRTRLGIAVAMIVAVLVLFGFYVSRLAG
jgi:rhomboid protease GluP